MSFSESSPGARRLVALAREIAIQERPTAVEVLAPFVMVEDDVHRRGDCVSIPWEMAVLLAEEQSVRLIG